MSGAQLDLNSLPEEGSYEYAGVLFKDNVMVSPIAAKNLPIKLPEKLNFTRIEPASYYPLDDLPSFDLHPALRHNFPDRRQEWHKFLSYLHSRDKVIPILIEGWELLIRPPKVVPSERSSVRVCYRRLASNRAPVQQVPPAPFQHVAPSIQQPVSDPAQPVHGSRTGGAQSVHGSGTGTSRTEVRDPSGNGIIQEKSVLPKQRRLGQMHPSYLQTLAQTHASWMFGGLAELVDNARDALANRLDISIGLVKMKGKTELMPMLRIADNGKGMNHEEIVRMLTFGHRRPEEDNKDHIGHFGVGFKTGSMRMGRDVVVLTQSETSRSIGFFSSSYNADKEVLEVPIVTYRKVYGIMELDLSVQTEEEGQACLQAVKRFSPFNEFEIGSMFEKIGDGKGNMGNGTHVFIYNLDRWGKEYALEWHDKDDKNKDDKDIMIRSRRVRARPGQTSKEIPLDYSLRAYLEVLFLDPRMLITIQGCKVKSTRLALSLNRTKEIKEEVMNKMVKLTLGFSKLEHERGNCGIFLYWHGRLIEAYKRVGGSAHSADKGRGVIGVIDVTPLMEHEDGRTSVLNTKQSFEDCAEYAKLEEWLGKHFNLYWDVNFDKLEVITTNETFAPDRDWVQCDKCQKWRKLPGGVHSKDLPSEWFCYMKPFARPCSEPEENSEDVFTVGVNRTAPSSDILTPKVEILEDNDDDLSTPIGHMFKRSTKKGVAVRTRPAPPSPKAANRSPIRKRLRRRS